MSNQSRLCDSHVRQKHSEQLMSINAVIYQGRIEKIVEEGTTPRGLRVQGAQQVPRAPLVDLVLGKAFDEQLR